jgi:cytoskeletal protein RodZ
MDDLGARLKRARESQGATLREVATRTKISVAALEALERNDFSRLPGGIFGRAFVRAYALEIGLDPEATVLEFQQRLEELEREAAARVGARPEVTADDREFLERQRRAVRILRIVAIVLAIGGVSLLAWQLHKFFERRDAAAPPADTVPAPVPPPASSTATPIAPPSAPLAAPAAPATPAAATDKLTIELEVTEDCWIYAATDGTRVFSQLFRTGDRRRLEADREILLDVGNAGAVKWTIDGRPAKPLGRTGVHQRTRISKANKAEFLQ